METIFVTRHPGAVEWLKKTHPEWGLAKLFGHVNTEDVRGRRVVGTLPIHLAAIAGEYWHLEMKLPPELRGKEKTEEEMTSCGAQLRCYRVELVENTVSEWGSEATK